MFDPAVEATVMSEIGYTKQVLNKYLKGVEETMGFPEVARDGDAYAVIPDHWNPPATRRTPGRPKSAS